MEIFLQFNMADSSAEAVEKVRRVTSCSIRMSGT